MAPSRLKGSGRIVDNQGRSLTFHHSVTDEEELRRKPSIRTQTIRYILAHLRYQPEGAKADILKQRPLCGALFQHLRDDPSDLVIELLRTIEQSVLKDTDLPRSAKAALLTERNLEKVTEIATRGDGSGDVSQLAFAWLKAVSTTPSYGVLRASGWYPPGSTKTEQRIEDESAINLGLDSLDFYDRSESFQVRNTTLLAWNQTLRPHANAQERELVLTCFEAAPELVHAYFLEKNMQLDPKLSNTWIGYASFLFEVIRLPVPERLGHVEEENFASLPPQIGIVMDSILPRPLTQKALTRCLNQSSELIRFFALRILVLAFRKIALVLMQIDATPTTERGQLWPEARERLLARFNEQCPEMKDVVGTFRQMPDDSEHAMQREAVTCLLRLFYEVTPLQAMEEPFDVSGALTSALSRGDKHMESDTVEDCQLMELRSLELEHLLVIASKSPGMQWFTKQGSLRYSPIVSLLRLHVKDHHNRQLRDTLGLVLYDHSILDKPPSRDSDRPQSSLDALVASLVDKPDAGALWTFLDDCFARASRQPVKYLDLMDRVYASSDLPRPYRGQPGLLLAVLSEQAPFVVSRTQQSERGDIMAWVNVFLSLLTLNAEASALTPLAKIVRSQKGWDTRPLNAHTLEYLLAGVVFNDPADNEPLPGAPNLDEDAALPFSAPAPESENHPELLRWAQIDLEIAIEEGNIDALMLCLCSQHAHILLQAQAQLKHLENKLHASSLEDKEQLFILVGELIETYEQHFAPADKPLPYLAGAFAAQALHVMIEPAHFMYPKLNRHLMKDPCWRVDKLPSYWLQATIISVPEDDDGYWKEVQWVLEWLVAGLRTSTDLDIMRKSGVFERVMALYSSPAASEHLVKQRVLELLYRATCIKGGSDTLITRAGVLSWLDIAQDGSICRTLRKRVLETCDAKRVHEWSGVDVSELQALPHKNKA